MLVHINITRDLNEYGERAYLVTPTYRHKASGRLMSVPDTKGWPTRAEAIAEAERIGGGKLEPVC